jgi:hypothetical protein
LTEQEVSPLVTGEETEPRRQASLSHPAGAPPVHHGRPTSWATTVTVIVGFVLGGAALTVGPAWWLFWTGAGLVVAAGLFGAAVRIFDDWY